MTTHYLFSYGTLQQPAVQIANFGRLLDGEADVLEGYKVDQVEITDPDVLAQSGLAFHPILRPSSQMRDSVAGSVFAVTLQDIERADRYEVEDYMRVLVTLKSGKQAWAYVERTNG
jgi:gamma-glutamylcyclotransferase (GGCT)/AIG2-like uncharacterized protein YtfP